MKKIIAFLSAAVISVGCWALAACTTPENEGGKPEEPPAEQTFTEKTYKCEFTPEETVKGNGYNDGYVEYLSRNYNFYQIDTLTLKTKDTFSLQKRLTTNNGIATDTAKVNVVMEFNGSYTSSGNVYTLNKPEVASASINWGTVNRGHEEGTFDSTTREGILNYFTTGFITKTARYENMDVTLGENDMFTFVVSGLESSDKDGNSDDFNVANIEELPTNSLSGKTIYWLGSSVTYGSASKQITMADYIAKRNNATCAKEAVSGTTLFCKSENDNSYSSRLLSSNKFDREANVDAFVCQISTNDINPIKNFEKIGTVTANDKRELSDFDRETTLGAVEYIIKYVKDTWDCPVIFYSGTEFGGEEGYYYGKLVAEIKKLEAKWDNLTVLDLFNDTEMNDIEPELYDYYMSDPIHPKKVGYLEWWTPKFEEALKKVIG